MGALQVLQIVNGLMSVGIQYANLRNMLSKLQQAQEEGRKLTKSELEGALEGLDEAQAYLARSIAEAKGAVDTGGS